ncbi:MAG: MoxR family ATPase [Clostridia bacterium]|nr:MoxR family ATPase [Clostridia bacterium]
MARASVEDVARFFQDLRANVARALVGLDEAVELVAVAVLAEGHVLFEDVPGVGKTRLAQAVARSLGGAVFKRVQFTPDLLPSDLTGTNVWRPEAGEFRFRPGPVFAHVLLADEVNRAAPRTQSALLEAMAERQVTVDGTAYPLPRPFLVLATQNPVELEGTFPLPEAQLDRFLLRIAPGYPDEADELEILARAARAEAADDVVPALGPVVALEELPALVEAVRRVEVHPDVRAFVLGLVRATRSMADVRLGASPRAALALQRAVQARAALSGRDYAVPEDVVALAVPVLGHRLLLSPEAELGGLTGADAVRSALARVPVPTEPV